MDEYDDDWNDYDYDYHEKELDEYTIYWSSDGVPHATLRAATRWRRELRDFDDEDSYEDILRYDSSAANEALSVLPTRLLMKLLGAARARGSAVTPAYGGVPPCSVSFDDLKEELSTREHIPTGEEAKMVRQKKAWNKKHR